MLAKDGANAASASTSTITATQLAAHLGLTRQRIAALAHRL